MNKKGVLVFSFSGIIIFFLLIVRFLLFSSTVDAQFTEVDLKVAFIGDQGLGAGAKAVLQLIKNEGASLVVHSGDLDYENNPDAWNKQINEVLGSDFPYLVSVGNHDIGPVWLNYYPWSEYQNKIYKRLSRIPGIECSGDAGVKSTCKYKGLFLVFSGIGTLDSGHPDYIKKKLAEDNSVWTICSWHKNQQAMQLGDKSNEVGWRAYEECRKGGAIIVTAHNHSYARTKTLKDISNRRIDPDCSGTNTACVSPGKTFVVVSGLGGKDREAQIRCLDGCKGEWAKIYTKNQNADFGALFIIFNYLGNPYLARGYFKTITGEIVDEFDIMAN